jgi:hypothetical protein
MNLRSAHLLLAAGIAILFTACKEGNIYSTLENEVKVDDLSLPNDITLFDVTKIGTSYYAAAGKIWTVSDSATEWDVTALIAPPSPGDIGTALVASPFGTNTLYGGFINGSGNLGLYESTAAPSFSGRNAEPLPVAGAQVALLKAVNDGANRLVVVTAHQPSAGSDFAYGMVYAASAGSYTVATFDATRPAGDEKKSINDVVYAGVPINAWFATEGTKLYTKTGPGFAGDFTLAGMTGITAGEELTGLFWDGTTHVYLASRAGAVYHSTDGTNWTRILAPAISGTYPPLTHFAGPVDAGIVLVGSDGYGYYLLDTADLSGTDPLTRYPTTTSDLYTAAVQKMYFDVGKLRVFACTSMGGLWRGAVLGDGSGSIDWNLE